MLKISQNNDNRGRHLEFYSHTGIGNWFQCFPVYPGLNLSSGSSSGSVSVSVSGSGSGSGFRIPAFQYAQHERLSRGKDMKILFALQSTDYESVVVASDMNYCFL